MTGQYGCRAKIIGGFGALHLLNTSTCILSSKAKRQPWDVEIDKAIMPFVVEKKQNRECESSYWNSV
jgi:hypothetical protein